MKLQQVMELLDAKILCGEDKQVAVFIVPVGVIAEEGEHILGKDVAGIDAGKEAASAGKTEADVLVGDAAVGVDKGHAFAVHGDTRVKMIKGAEYSGVGIEA